MNTRKMLAAALRERSNYSTLCKSADLADAIEPTNVEESLLQIALRPTETSVFLGELAEYFDSVKSAPVVGTAQQAPSIPTLGSPVVEVVPFAENGPGVAQVATQAPESTVRILDEDETIEAGDEWRLRDGLHHRDRSKPVEWRLCGGSVGGVVSDFPDSIFRRH